MSKICCVLLILLTLEYNSTSEITQETKNYYFYENALQYVLQAIEFWSSLHAGVFSCVFYYAGPTVINDNILDAVLHSPRLNHVIKYVVNGTYQNLLLNLQRNPSMVLMHPGHDHLKLRNHFYNVTYILSLFTPATQMVTFVDYSYPELLYEVHGIVHWVGFSYSVFIDSRKFCICQCNGVTCWNWEKFPRLIYLFSYKRNYMANRNITYVESVYFGLPWNHHWLNETARYLNTKVTKFHHNCKGTGDSFRHCLDKLSVNQGKFSIILHPIWTVQVTFGAVCTSIPLFLRIAVPRDRPLNVAELMVMPFSWQVWALLTLTLTASEIIKHLFPHLFKNDPILLVVCGFERHDLHRAGRWEKIAFLSLMVLMFFMTNAFETKIVSLMTKKPSIQRIKTLDDLYRSDVKFYDDLEHSPHFKHLSIVGAMMVQGENPQFGETIPGVGAVWRSDWVDLFHEMAFDYDRMQPFYVVLDYEHFECHECYPTEWRFPLLETFRHIHITLVEAGLVNLWKRQWRDEMRSVYIGRRYRVDIRNKMELNFDDLQPAWMTLAVGLSVSVVGFLGEHLTSRFGLWWSRNSKWYRTIYSLKKIKKWF